MSDEPAPGSTPACPHPEAAGARWGDPISDERQAQLQGILGAWDTPDADHGDRQGPFDGVRLSGADASWLAERSGRDEFGRAPNLHLEGANLREAHVEGAYLIGAHLEGASLREAHLEGAFLRGAHVERADLFQTHLERADLSYAHLERANLFAAHLEGAALFQMHLEGANLGGAHLEGANLGGAHLERADLSAAHLEGATLGAAHLEGATLWSAHLERADLDGTHLEGADLISAHLEGARLGGAHLEGARLGNAHLEGADLREVHLERAYVISAHLERASLYSAHLEGADLRGAHLERAILWQAQLEGADLRGAHLGRANLREAHLTGTNLGGAHLEGAALSAAHVEGAILGGAHLEGADLDRAHLEGADLREAHLEGATLRGATVDGKTALAHATLAESPTRLERLLNWWPFMRRTTSAALGDIRWGGVGTVDLTAVRWDDVLRLGDEREAGWRDDAERHAAVVRAYRQLAAQLRAQGMSEVADRFALRAQVRQRGVLLRRVRLGPYLFSGFLAVLAGYGYRPGRTIFWYLAVVAGFAALYLQFGLVDGHPFNPVEALVFSLTSFHGRGFFPGGLPLDDPVTVLAAGEAVLGLLIEISFIATFTQRFFGAK